MNIRSYRRWFALAVIVAGTVLTPSAYSVGPNDRFTNIGSIANTRHNMSQSTATGGISVDMDLRRNNYAEVCVYCHTPHGSNTLPRMPLWNRTIKATTYTTYDQLGTSTLTQPVTQPGNNSLTCLSCHDGQTATDSVINMPGSGNYLASQDTSQNTAFLNAWTNPTGGTEASQHQGFNSTNGVLGDGTGNGAGPGCLVCHSDTGAAGGGLVDFTIAFIGTNLTNDHPVGITFPPNGPGTDFNTPAGVKGTSLYFEANGNGHMDTDEIRTYDGKVECASCHDPHGVPSAGPGTVFKPTFLRVNNTASNVCLTCHAK